MKKNYTTVLTIAGSDGSGGAGIQADLRTFAALECYGLSVITAVTSQNTLGVDDVMVIDSRAVASQFRSIACDIRIDAVKIGMTGNCRNIITIASLLCEIPGNPPVILDTVLGSSGGKSFLGTEAITVMKEELFPLTSMVTPNLPEAAILAGMEYTPSTTEEIEEAAALISVSGASSVLVKGGHGTGNLCCDCLLCNDTFSWYTSEKVETVNTHGTGCTLSSAIAAFMAKGAECRDAVKEAKLFLTEALAAGAAYRLGSGNGPLHHCYRLW
ncbi:MAG: bifunctional hydroxymethylpyrimidine kinase/phosphomethylpyrimidine kinase [Chlorobiaceae bacterium]|nr:bifunctional hydroxymethylpyrimidine kinase/phosphomethylpyrimidine kinase [Chlorobiaceae bacterium]NTV60518.1 bifunctional hydroxymethylpyrimidine kinase/phosphomethylpyrimidine kinase [Chlorobiaceae bacterium]